MGFERVLLLACILVFTVFAFLNLRKWIKYKTSFIPTVVSMLVLLAFILMYTGKNTYAYALLLITALIAIVYLPNVWKDWVKVLRYEDVNLEERIKLRDYFSWKLFIKLGYRYGVKKAAFLYALNYSAIFAIGYCTFGTLLSMRYSYVVALVVAIVILPVNYHLARKTIEKLMNQNSYLGVEFGE